MQPEATVNVDELNVELEEEDLNYTRKMNELRNLKEMKQQQLDLMRQMSRDTSENNHHLEEITHEIKKLIIEKDSLNEILQNKKRHIEEVQRKVDQFSEDLIKM